MRHVSGAENLARRGQTDGRRGDVEVTGPYHGFFLV
jgi:hypothetical protein